MKISNIVLATSLLLLWVPPGPSLAQPGQAPGTRDRIQPIDWRESEVDILDDQVQLTFSRDFVKAGEAYFSPDGQWIIFQAVPVPAEGDEPDPFYSMYVGKLKWADNRLSGLEKWVLISPPGSANTCGFFHPTTPGSVIFGSTISRPSESEAPGFRREDSKYRWMFPPETEVVRLTVPQITSDQPTVPGLEGDDVPQRGLLTSITHRTGYDAECAYSPDGRYIVFCAVQDPPRLGDLFIIDTQAPQYAPPVPLVTKAGYDGGPFFSPDGKRICYRSDRRGDNYLQLFVADLDFDSDGRPQGIKTEYQLTDDGNVNWAPYWHPNGRLLVYASSAVSHRNYEVFILDADPGNLEGSDGTVRYGLRKRRITHASGFDGLPVFNADGSWMMWTSQRTANTNRQGPSHVWAARFIMETDPQPIRVEGEN